MIGAPEQSRTTVLHPEVGDVDVDGDALTTRRSDLRVVVFTARPGTDARSTVGLLAAAGTQSLLPAGADRAAGPGPANRA